MKNKLASYWHALSKMVILALLVVMFLGIAFLAGGLTETSAIVLGTAAIVFAVLSLRE